MIDTLTAILSLCPIEPHSVEKLWTHGADLQWFRGRVRALATFDGSVWHWYIDDRLGGVETMTTDGVEVRRVLQKALHAAAQTSSTSVVVNNVTYAWVQRRQQDHS